MERITLKEISEMFSTMETPAKIEKVLNELLTASEINVLSKRWRILKMLDVGVTQRDISKELGVSLCKVTRGAKILKDKNTLVTKFLKRRHVQ